MNADKIWLDYCDYLIDLVGLKEKLRVNYSKMIQYIHTIPFTYTIALDENRLKDGLRLRSDFTDNIGELEKYPCSVLEVLIAFAIRIDQEYTGNPKDPHPDIVFWDMIFNLRLDTFNNRHFNEKKVFNIVLTWLLRNFDPDGDGSIFPLRESYDNTDQRNIEMWAQMLYYLRSWRWCCNFVSDSYYEA